MFESKERDEKGCKLFIGILRVRIKIRMLLFLLFFGYSYILAFEILSFGILDLFFILKKKLYRKNEIIVLRNVGKK